MDQQSAVASMFSSPVPARIHIDDETCPSCGQEIPPEKLEEIKGRIAVREREKVFAITTDLETRFEKERSKADAEAEAALALARRDAETREATARAETQKAADAVLNEKLAEAERVRQAEAAELQKNLDDASAARAAAEELKGTLQEQLLQMQRDGAAAIEAAKKEAKEAADAVAAQKLAAAESAHVQSQAALKQQIAQAEAAIEGARAEALQAAEAASAQKLAAAEHAHAESEAALNKRITAAEESKLAAERAQTSLTQQVQQITATKDAEVAKLKEDAAQEALRIRQEALETAKGSVQEQMTAKEEALAEATAKAANLGKQLSQLTAQHEENIVAQREALEKAGEAAINAEKARAFEETQKMQNKLNDMQRALDKKSSEELGEGAEIDLFEALKADFPDDQITRVKKGAAGADIIHVVFLQGRECGKIIYDSKNHKKFHYDHVTKLRNDQLAAKAEHAILSTHSFPKGTGQLHLHDGVILANPARVVTIATMVRRHLIYVHTLRLSDVERERKTAKLYDYITSERCTQLMAKIDSHAEDLLEQQIKEITWHEKNWRKQGETFRAIQKAKIDIENDIGAIVGTAADDECKPAGSAAPDQPISEAS